ncbi:MAG: hypothetical protein PHG85_01210 [Candidatus Altiarchaeota archaeon]|nr:hypothetical protein [Candidatus Altiarchaeota archaeon]
MEATNADNEKQLCRFIAEKHERFLSQYLQEVASLERIFVLQEEIDQFNHWISAGKLNYSERKSRAVAELNSLSRNTSKKINAKRIEAIKLKIKEHEAALGYWRGRGGS